VAQATCCCCCHGPPAHLRLAAKTHSWVIIIIIVIVTIIYGFWLTTDIIRDCISVRVVLPLLLLLQVARPPTCC
jgi:hypothetical protein